MISLKQNVQRNLWFHLLKSNMNIVNICSFLDCKRSNNLENVFSEQV